MKFLQDIVLAKQMLKGGGGWGVGGGGANINGELLVENMKKLSLISLRIMYDHFSVNKSDLHN